MEIDAQGYESSSFRLELLSAKACAIKFFY